VKRKVTYVLLAAAVLLFSSCLGETDRAPYDKTLSSLSVETVYPEGYESCRREGVAVVAEEVNLGNRYEVPTDAAGLAKLTLPCGLYRVTVSDRLDEDIFNAAADRVKVSGAEASLRLGLLHSKAGSIVIKEIYCGGCKRLPLEGDYHYDSYVILHNNNVKTEYLDSLCFGTLMPFNSNATNNWVKKDPVTGETVFNDFIPVAQCVWQFGGSGRDFPLEPGEDAVVVIFGAIDHTLQYPLSVNLNRPEYFVCYNPTYFTMTTYHPAPGDQIREDHILDVVKKTGQAKAYTFSQNSPAVVIFKARGTTMQEFVELEGSVKETPGDTHNPIIAIPEEWVVDAVEVFNGGSSSNTKRLSPTLDAGYVLLSDTSLGRTLFRYTDEDLTASSGFEVLKDSNNSSNDFYERETQSLHED